MNVRVLTTRESNWELMREKPLWPGINVCHLEGRIYVRSRAYVIKQFTCIEEESIYGRSDHPRIKKTKGSKQPMADEKSGYRRLSHQRGKTGADNSDRKARSPSI